MRQYCWFLVEHLVLVLGARVVLSDWCLVLMSLVLVLACWPGPWCWC
jgi:hypothetical protein